MNRKLLIGAGALIAALGAAAFMMLNGDGDSSGLAVETGSAETRDLSRTVASTGAIAPLVIVEVGSQLSGQLIELHADFNDEVEAGQLIARLDPQSFETRVREAQASLEVAAAQVEVARANVTNAQSQAREAQRAFERAQELLARGTYAQAQFDTAETARDSAQSQVLVAQANLRNAQATLVQREASLESAEVDLQRTYIRSPIDGVIVDRQVDVGQTVAASLNAPVLFLIAQDLSRIQIEAQVDESDIGNIAVNQAVTFEVDAFREREFRGQVRQVRLAALAEQNVVTYTVVIEADNPGQRLLPGMTANVTIVTGEVEDALSVPSAALRFVPRGAAETLIASRAEGGQRATGGRMGGMADRLLDQLELEGEQRDHAARALETAFSQNRPSGGFPGAQPDFRGIMQRALADVLEPAQMARLEQIMSQQPGRGGRGGGGRGAGGDAPQPGAVWVRGSDGRLHERRVMIGLSDGAFTQIVGGDLEEGDQVVIRVRETA
jgi:HlyD family secretion protein